MDDPAGATRPVGLTGDEVAQRVADGRTNRVDQHSSRSVGEIVRANVFTRFNAIVAVLAGTVIALGDLRDALFGVVAVANAGIGILQEWRAKVTLERLTLVSAPQVSVWRDGAVRTIPREEIVLDDVVELGPGDQVVVDGDVLRSAGLTVDESLVTGESAAVDKPVGARLLSGSFVTAGAGAARATAVGADSYAERLAAQARQFRMPRSELSRGIDRILQVVTWAIVPTALIVFFGQRAAADGSLRTDLIGAVAGVVALVPQGLVLLLSMAQAVAVIRLGRRGVLVQQLSAVETLARVTVLATDKTGTLTDGEVTLSGVEPLPGGDTVPRAVGPVPGPVSAPAAAVPAAPAVPSVLAGLAGADEHPNATVRALAQAYPEPPGWPVLGTVPFDSARKYSAVDFGTAGTWVLGAPEVLLGRAHPARVRVDALAGEGLRVLLLARASTLPAAGTGPPGDLAAVALLAFADDVRADAAQTIAYFQRESVVPKVLSGDNPLTVTAIARRCGVPNADRAIDAADLPTEPEGLGRAAEAYAVFGRVTPEDKRTLLHALQARGYVVAMTGDGVNDTLALKDADLGIAMGSGTPAARSVAQLVLLDDRFATLPGVVAEGRRVIANIERVARLFVTKNVWAAVLAVLTGLLRMSYPLLPRQLTVIDALTIGIPGFVLSFQPSHDPVRSGFIHRVLRFAVPCGVVAGLTAMGVFALGRSTVVGASRAQAQSAATLALVALGLWVLYELARPLDAVRRWLLVAMVALGIGAYAVPPVARFFQLQVPSGRYAVGIAGLLAAGIVLIRLGLQLAARLVKEPPDGPSIGPVPLGGAAPSGAAARG